MDATRHLKALLTATLIGAGLLTAPSASSADGLPMVNLDTSEIGISDRDGDVTYYALPEEGETTLLRTGGEPDGIGRTLTQRTLDGTLAVPGVAWDGTTSGLSSLGGRLVLIEPRQRFPRERTRLVMVDATSLRTVAELDLKGDYSFDAVSPDGGLIYLIHYFDPKDPSVYEVRAWDLESERLLPEPIIDQRIAPEVMRGYPMTRATSPDGEWEYTLYDGGGKKPFVHALNTATKTALCVDLPSLQGQYVGDYGLVPSEDGASVGITNRRAEEVASFSTSDWLATGSQEADEHEGHEHEAEAEEPADSSSFAPAGAVVLVLLAAGGLFFGLRRRSRTPSP
jgi:hypothetical protein